MINPDEDGITHINVYSQGKTELGRFLSNWSYSPIDLGEDGKFLSVEGYWYWLGSTHQYKDRLRTVHGYAAKQMGRALRSAGRNLVDDFTTRIKHAIWVKVTNRPDICKLLRENQLPLLHYYVYSGRVVEPTGLEWLMIFLNELGGKL